MRCNVITLPGARSRSAGFCYRNPQIAKPTLVEAVDGWALTPQQIREHADLRPPLIAYNPGQIGCALSHIKLWKRIARAKSPECIFEDDVYLRADFNSQARAFLASLPTAWDIVYWGVAQWCHFAAYMPGSRQSVTMDFSPLPAANDLALFQRATSPTVPLRLQNAWSTAAYALSPPGARKCLAAVVPIQNRLIPVHQRRIRQINDAIDSELSGLLTELEAYVCFPFLAVCAPERPRVADELSSGEG